MLAIRPFTAADVPLGMRLKTQAGWNQLEADWRRMLDMQPDGCFVAEYGSTPVGTVMTCIFDGVAWIAMMLVEESLRGKGIGRALMEHALSYLDEQGVRTVRLDATPLGQPLYEKLGFVAEYSLARHAGTPVSGDNVSGVILAAVTDREQIFSLDRSSTHTDRRKLLARLLDERQGFVVRENSRLRGYLLTRAGAHATQIGPCIADGLAGPLLLNDALAQHAGNPVYIDIPLAHEPAAALARERGLAVQRQLLRMCRGERMDERVDRLWASSGPELG
ncbi:MAG TPA: GNAT family N-acetyltransferase [Pirellulaceae bacterium]|nr:GNAT family N-acetyltransferase [Pirellulaceae bacterium]